MFDKADHYFVIFFCESWSMMLQVNVLKIVLHSYLKLISCQTSYVKQLYVILTFKIYDKRLIN